MKVITIGRSTDNNNIVIDDIKVSRSHLQIINDDNGNFHVIDLDSTNGTFVNGKRVSGKVQLHKGDTVVIGSATLPWEEYFNPKSDNDKEDKNTKPSNKRLYIIISSILICILIGVIAIIVNNNKKNEQDIEASYDRVTRAYSEETKEANEAREDAEKEASRAKMEADAANREAAKAKENAEKTKNKAKQDVDKANQKVADAEEAAATAKAEAEQKVNAANQKAADAEEAAATAKAEAEQKVNAANQKAADAEEAAASAIESEQLTEDFYELLSSLNNAKIKSVCENMQLKGKDKEALKAYFKNANNEGKKNIIETIKKVKNMPEPTEEEKQQPSETVQQANQEQAEPDNTKVGSK